MSHSRTRDPAPLTLNISDWCILYEKHHQLFKVSFQLTCDVCSESNIDLLDKINTRVSNIQPCLSDSLYSCDTAHNYRLYV